MFSYTDIWTQSLFFSALQQYSPPLKIQLIFSLLRLFSTSLTVELKYQLKAIRLLYYPYKAHSNCVAFEDLILHPCLCLLKIVLDMVQ